MMEITSIPAQILEVYQMVGERLILLLRLTRISFWGRRFECVFCNDEFKTKTCLKEYFPWVIISVNELRSRVN